MEKRLTLGLFFGGRSVEHEVSVITALQAYENLDENKYDIIPVYISKSGQFYTNQKLLKLGNFKDVKALTLSSTKVTLGIKNSKGGIYTQGLLHKFIPLDVALPALHGSFGEDGCIQGLFETYQIPYVGFSVLGSSIGMDKHIFKLFCQALGFPIGKYIVITRFDWQNNHTECLDRINKHLKWPLFVKPATIGSSIGVNIAKDLNQIAFAVDVAAVYSEKILVEEAFQNVIEINCSALGYKDPKPSVCEQPVSLADILSFADKYQRGESKGSKKGIESMTRIIPAPISTILTRKIEDITVRIFKALDGCGIARVDYFVDPKKELFWVNEINTIPGSLSFYLWKNKGFSYKKLLDKLIEHALERANVCSKTQYTFESGLLSQMANQAGIQSGQKY